MRYFTSRNIFLLLLFWLVTGSLYAQNKVERELGIKERDVPKQAVDWLKDTFETTRRPKWYKEIFESGYSYEAKFRLKGKFYSAEFDSTGKIEDVEIEHRFGELPREVQDSLRIYFSESYLRFNFKRIQVQYSGEPYNLEDFFDENTMEGILVRYEIEYYGIDESGASQLWEGLFSEAGELIRKRKIVLAPSENLIF